MKHFFGLSLIASVLAVANGCQSVKAPEASSLFEERVDPVSGVVSYALKYGAPDDNRQSLYFVTKSMTEDGRYLVFMYTEGNERKGLVGERCYKVADLKKGKVSDLGRTDMPPFIEPKEGYMVYGDPGRGFFRRDFRRPDVEVKLCDIPQELSSIGEIKRLATHLTLTMDRRKAFLDTGIEVEEGRMRYVQGLLDLATGDWDEWGETSWDCNHGQLNPTDDSFALCAWEYAWEGEGMEYKAATGWYPRMWLVRKGSKELIPALKRNFASHEIWDDDGKGLSWCGRGTMLVSDCLYHLDLATGKQKAWCKVPGARHGNCSPDGKYVVCDQAPERWWRGCKWRVAFWNRETGKYVWIYSTREALNPRDRESTLHPDPHPHFVMGGRYVVSTACNGDGHMDLFVTPVGQLVKMTE